MVSGLVHTNDANTDFQLLIQDTDINGTTATLDISGATVKQMIFQDPDGTETTVTAAFLTTGVDGILRFINVTPTVTGYVNITVGGPWKYRAHIEFSDGGVFESSDALFQVLDK